MHVGYSLLTLFPGRVGGSESNVRGLLAEYARGNGPDRVTVLANRHVLEPYQRYARGPVSIHHVRSYRPGDGMASRAAAMAAARALPRLAAREVPGGLDVLHYPVTVPIPRTAAPTVVSVYDLQHHDLPEFFSRAERMFRRWAYDGAARGANVVVTSSEHTRRRLLEVLELDPGRVEVVHLGIDTDRFGPEGGEDERVLAPLDLPERFAVYPANLWPHKNHARLIDGLAASGDADLSLVLTGQVFGALDGLMERARRAGVAERVRHLGYLDAHTVPALYRRAAAMIFPSLYEGFGAPPLEAMACGCPVAASTRGSLGELCAGAALELDPESVESIGEAVRQVTSDRRLRERLRAAGLERAGGFSWSTAARLHTEIYGRAVELSSS